MILILNTSCSDTSKVEVIRDVAEASIERYPGVISSERIKLESFPVYDKYSSEPLEIDLRNCDITLLNLLDKFDALLRADFDTRTIWPYSLPEGINPKKILETGKCPGPGIRQMHKEGVNGKGVGIAVIASPPLAEHSEYAGRIKLYREIGGEDENTVIIKPDKEKESAGGNTVIIKSPEEADRTAGSHNAANPETTASAEPLSASYEGTAIASIIAGRTTGVAPGAVLYYFSPVLDMSGSDNSDDKLSCIIKALEEISDLNDKLPPEDKIRAVVIENCLLTGKFMSENSDKLQSTVTHMLDSGVLLLPSGLVSSVSKAYNVKCLGRSPLSSPDKLESYGAGYEWEIQFLTYNDDFETVKNGCFLVPGDSRTTASPTGNQDYVFNRAGGVDFATAYLAGLYALACQAYPAVTPDSFIKAAINTGREITVEKYGLKRSIKYVLDPLRIVENIGA